MKRMFLSLIFMVGAMTLASAQDAQQAAAEAAEAISAAPEVVPEA